LFLDSRKAHRDDVDPVVRRNLLLMAQVITSGRSRSEPGRRPAVTDRFSFKIVVMMVIFLLPIFISGLIIYDWFWFVYLDHEAPPGDPAQHWFMADFMFRFLKLLTPSENVPIPSGFISEPEFMGGIATILIIFWEIRLVTAIARVLGRLSHLNWNIQSAGNAHHAS